MNQEQARKLIAQDIRHKEYMAAYNQRPEVKAARRERNKLRWAMIKAAREIMKEENL